jgi:ribosomal RNA-processing protein 7
MLLQHPVKKTFEPPSIPSLNRQQVKMSKTPTKINEYLVLPIKLPDRIVESTLHYLYLRRHAPKVATPGDSRSLFAVNVPVDSTEAHLRGLFSRIGGGMVDSVVFDGEDKNKRKEEAAPADSKKRKRVDEADVEAAATVTTWDRELRRSGSTAVVVFVDKASVEITLKAVSKASKVKKQGEVPVWGEGISDANKIPALGISRMAAIHQKN